MQVQVCCVSEEQAGGGEGRNLQLFRVATETLLCSSGAGFNWGLVCSHRTRMEIENSVQ